MAYIPERFADEAALEDYLSTPSEALTAAMKRLDGDIMILGIAGKMGVTLGRRALNAARAAGVNKKVFGAARFSDPAARAKLDQHGITTIACDLLDPQAVAELPRVRNVIFMAGRKFGTEGSEDLTWAMNVLAPYHAAEHFRQSRFVAFSTGCVYPLVPAASGGCPETTAPEPVGEYAQSCLGRERILQYAARRNGTKMLFFRLNYAIDLRYGVLHDIATAVWRGEKVNNSVGCFNIIWQGSANEAALRALEYTGNPPRILNVTGPETLTVTAAAETFGRLFGKKVEYLHETPGDRCYLNNAAAMTELFGPPEISPELNKPTHFEVNNGKF